MGNILEFYLKLKDMMSGPLAKVAKAGKDGFAQVEKAVRSVQTSMDTAKKKGDILGQSYDMLKRKAQQLESAISKSTSLSHIKAARVELSRLNSEMKNHAGNMDKGGGGGLLSGLMGRFAPLAIAGALALGAGSFAKASAQQYMNFEKNNKSFEVLAGNKGIGQNLGMELNELKQNTILGPAVYQNAKTMMSFGITAEKVIPHLKMLGEVSMGDAERLQSLTLAFSQTNAAGKLMGQDLLQYVNAGFNPLHEISVMTGKSMADLRKQMEQGAISSDMVVKAFQHATGAGGLFNNMLGQMAETTGGKLQNLHGKIAALEIALGERFNGTMNATLDITSSIVTAFKHWIEIPMVQKLDQQIGKIRGLHYELTSANTSHARQVAILRELEQINPNITKGISEQSIQYGKLADNINAVVGALENKKIVENITDENRSFLDSYALFQKKQQDDISNIIGFMGQVGDSRLLDPSLSFGKKQVLAQEILLEKLSKQPQKFLGAPSKESLLYNRLSGSIADYNRSEGYLLHNKTRFEGIQNQINASKKIYEQMLGIKSMTAAQIKDGKGGTNSAAAAGVDTAAKNVTSGGPRVININGVKFMDKLELHTANLKEGEDEMQRRLEEMFLRILNSGATVQ